MRRLRRFCFGLAAWALALPAAGGDVLPLPAFGAEAWRPLAFPRVERHTRYDVQPGGESLRARSACSASAWVVPVDGLDLARTPILTWRWKVARPVRTPASEREKPGDDFAARVYVSFRFDAERASRWEALKRRAAESIYGAELPGKALNYVWARRESAGSQWDNPYTADSRMLSLGQGPLREWRTESVDVAADYRTAFGVAPPPVLFVGIMSDSDDSCDEAEAWFSEFRFETGSREAPPDPAAEP